jgi:hypothetical protein
VQFVTEWIPEHYPDYRFTGQDIPLKEWYKTSRAAMREKVFTLFPQVTPEYYSKRTAHLKEVEEHRLRDLLMKAIPADREGWTDDMPRPRAIVTPTVPTTPPMSPTMPTDKPVPYSLSKGLFEDIPSPPHTPPLSPILRTHLPPLAKNPLDTPLYLTLLPRDPPLAFTAHPPSATMSLEAKLLCVARWTRFSPSTGLPCLAHEPREKKFEMRWSEHGVSDEVLTAWVREMFWGSWARQAEVNYVGAFELHR